jgi:hypothetical protein
MVTLRKAMRLITALPAIMAMLLKEFNYFIASAWLRSRRKAALFARAFHSYKMHRTIKRVQADGKVWQIWSRNEGEHGAGVIGVVRAKSHVEAVEQFCKHTGLKPDNFWACEK